MLLFYGCPPPVRPSTRRVVPATETRAASCSSRRRRQRSKVTWHPPWRHPLKYPRRCHTGQRTTASDPDGAP
eukprot:scaffold36200_cov63-Phaeocystis_antarctica.AAC.2